MIPGLKSVDFLFKRGSSLIIQDNQRNTISISSSGGLGFIGGNISTELQVVSLTGEIAQDGGIIDLFSLDTSKYYTLKRDAAGNIFLVLDRGEKKSAKNFILSGSFYLKGVDDSVRVRYSLDNSNWTTLDQVVWNGGSNDFDLTGNNFNYRYIEIRLHNRTAGTLGVHLKALLITE
jgi:hypothetical protein